MQIKSKKCKGTKCGTDKKEPQARNKYTMHFVQKNISPLEQRKKKKLHKTKQDGLTT